MLNVIMLSAVMLSAVMLKVITLSIVAPYKQVLLKVIQKMASCEVRLALLKVSFKLNIVIV